MLTSPVRGPGQHGACKVMSNVHVLCLMYMCSTDSVFNKHTGNALRSHHHVSYAPGMI